MHSYHILCHIALLYIPYRAWCIAICIHLYICIYIYVYVYCRNDLADTLANEGKSGRACKQGRYAIGNKPKYASVTTNTSATVVSNSNSSNVIIDLSLDDPSPPPSRPSSPLKQGVTATTDLTRTSSPLPPPISPPATPDTADDDDQSTDEIEFNKYKANLTKKIAKIDSPPSLYKYLKYKITSLSRRIAQSALVSSDSTSPLPPRGERRGVAGDGGSGEGESKEVVESPSPKSRKRKRGGIVVDSVTLIAAPSSSSSSSPLLNTAPASTQDYGTGRLISSLPSTSSDLPYAADYTGPYHPIDASLIPTKKRRRTKRSLSQDAISSESESEGISMASVSSDSRLLAVVGEAMPGPITDIIVSEGPEKMDGGDLSNNHKLGIMRHKGISE